MSKIIPERFTLLLVFLLAAATRNAMGAHVTNLYQIVSGEYIVCCGIAGEFRSELPTDGQSHVQLVTDTAQQSARMTILSFFDGEPIFQVIENGRLHADYIEFGIPISFPGGAPGLGMTKQHYIVSNSASGIRFSGATVFPPMGADFQNFYAHSNVVARLRTPAPVEATIRVSCVEICWPSVSNLTYQVQYRSSIDSNAWVNLQSRVLGNGGIRCVVDNIAPDQPRRFYRVIPVP